VSVQLLALHAPDPQSPNGKGDVGEKGVCTADSVDGLNLRCYLITDLLNFYPKTYLCCVFKDFACRNLAFSVVC
jgi:hypothetical protein